MSPVNMRRCPKSAKAHSGKWMGISWFMLPSLHYPGHFREVFKAREKNSTTNKFVAMKKVLMENEKEGVRDSAFFRILTRSYNFLFSLLLQFPITALREIRILQLLNHENVVNLIEICRTKATNNNRYRSTFYLVFDFCEHDLAGLLSNSMVKFSLGEIKMVMKQLLNGLYHIHSNKVNIINYIFQHTSK